MHSQGDALCRRISRLFAQFAVQAQRYPAGAGRLGETPKLDFCTALLASPSSKAPLRPGSESG